MKNIKRNIVLILIAIIICIPIIYMCFIQRWECSVNVSDAQISSLQCIQNIKSGDINTFNEKLFDVSDGEEAPEVESTSIKEKSYKNDSFSRKLILLEENDNSKIEIEYSFNDSPYSMSVVSISLSDVVNNSYFAFQSVEDLEKKLSNEIGSYRPIYNRYLKKEKNDNISYCITPITSSSRNSCFYFFVTDGLERTVDSVYEIGAFSISIHEYIPPKTESKYSVILDDVYKLLLKASEEGNRS